jgi:DNA-binding transcriptional LysR family regulator
MDIRHLKTLIAIAEHGSFAKAAAALGITQPAVSQQVRTLESELGVALFDRSIRPPALNADGQALVAAGRRIIEIGEEAVDSITGRRQGGTFTLGAVRTSLLGRLPRALALLKDAHPGLRLRLLSGLTHDLVHDVAGGHLDAAIISDGSQIPTGLNWYPFMREPLYAIAPPGQAAASVKELLESGPFIHFQRAVPLAALIDRELARLGVNYAPALEVDTLPAVVRLVRHGLGVSVVTHDALYDPGPAEVTAMPLGDPPVHRIFGLVERINSPKGDLVRRLHAHLFACAGILAMPFDWP